MHIIHITDQHVGHPGDDSYGIDVRNNFLRLLQAVEEESPDLLIHSGDLCLDVGDRELYHWCKKHLDALDIPYYVLSGNHDDPAMMAEVFDLTFHLSEEERLYYRVDLAGHSCLMLDTTPGRVDAPQLDWLDTQLQLSEGPLLVFMHHPPLYMGVQWMDQHHSLKNRSDVAGRLKAYGDRVTVFCGHFHNARTVQEDNLTVHLTPSSYFQIDPRLENFAVEHGQIGYRNIYLMDDQIQHAVVYLW